MNMKKIAQAFRLLADAMEETAARFEDTPAAGVSGPDKAWKEPEKEPEKKPEPKPCPQPVVDTTPPAVDTTPAPALEPAQPTMSKEEFTKAMQALGREVGPGKLHAALPAVWEKFTDGVARMSAIPADRYAEIVQFTREEVEKQA